MQKIIQFLATPEKAEIASVYFKQADTCAFIAGYPVFSDASHTLLSLAAPDGSYDGMALLNNTIIYRLEKSTQYLQSLNECAHPLKCDFVSKDSLLAYLCNQGVVVQVMDISGRRILYGILRNYTEDFWVFQSVCRDGRISKIRRIALCKIGGLFWDSEAENRILPRVDGRERQ